MARNVFETEWVQVYTSPHGGYIVPSEIADELVERGLAERDRPLATRQVGRSVGWGAAPR